MNTKFIKHLPFCVKKEIMLEISKEIKYDINTIS